MLRGVHARSLVFAVRLGVINLGTGERALVLAALDELEALHARLLEHLAWRSSTRVN